MTNPISSKKAIFFTSIALLITSVLIITYGTPTSGVIKDRLPSMEAKANAANEMARDLKNSYLPQSLHIATYSAFSAMSEYMRQKGSYFTGPDADLIFNITLKEMVVNGTMCCAPGCNDALLSDVNDPSKHKGVDDCLGKAIMNGRNLTKRLNDMENASQNAFRIKTRFGRDYNGMQLYIFQNNDTGPFMVGANLTVNYSVAAGDVMINNTENISVIFSIVGISDPLYAVESTKVAKDGLVQYTNYFNTTNITHWNISTFYHEVEWRLYSYEPNATSFVSRFYGTDERSACCGIESLINPLVMGSVNGGLEKPYVDWCYYGPANRCTSATTGAMWNVTCVTTEVDGTKFFNYAIDTYHAQQYNLTGIVQDYLYGAGPPPACPETPFPAP